LTNLIQNIIIYLSKDKYLEEEGDRSVSGKRKNNNKGDRIISSGMDVIGQRG